MSPRFLWQALRHHERTARRLGRLAARYERDAETATTGWLRAGNDARALDGDARFHDELADGYRAELGLGPDQP